VNWTLGTEEASHDNWGVAVLDHFAAAVAKRTNDNFKIRVTIANELGIKREDYPMALSTAKIEMGMMAHGHVAGTVPHLAIYSLPFLVGAYKGITEDALAVDKATRDMTVRELKNLGIGIAFGYPSVPTELISKTPVADISDMKGLKVRAWDELTSNFVKALNGVPVVMPIAEVYLAMQRGVVDAGMTGVGTGMIPMSLQELAKNLYLIDLAPAFIYITYSQKAFDALPAEYQKIQQEEWANAIADAKKLQSTAHEESLTFMKKAGVTIIQPTPDQMNAAKAKVKFLWEEWAKKSATNKEAYDAVMKALGA
jgi:C4-dicarboxylate-binding protein DctP